MAKIGHFPQNPEKVGISRFPGPRRGLLLHQPLAAGPCGLPEGVWRGLVPPRRGGEVWDLLGGPESRSRGPRSRNPVPEGRRAPPRGVDVKATPAALGAGLPGPPPGGPGFGRIPGIPDPRSPRTGPRSRRSRRGPAAPPRPLGAPRPPRRGLFYINPSRRGPVPVPGTWVWGTRTARRKVTPGRPGPRGCKDGNRGYCSHQLFLVAHPRLSVLPL